MTKIELEKRLQEENLMTIYDDGVEKHYIDGEKLIENGVRMNATNVFGVYKGQKNYVVFITDDERGLPHYIDKFGTEDEACESLYEYVKLLKRIYDKGL